MFGVSGGRVGDRGRGSGPRVHLNLPPNQVDAQERTPTPTPPHGLSETWTPIPDDPGVTHRGAPYGAVLLID